MAYNDPPTDSLTPSRPMPAQPVPPPPMPPTGVSIDVVVVHLSYLVAQMGAMAPKLDALHDASMRRDSEVRSLRSNVRQFSETLDEHSDLHREHKKHLSDHCSELNDLNNVAAADGEPKSWVGKLGAKCVDAVIPMILTVVFFGALAGWTGVRLQWGAPVQQEKTSTTVTTTSSSTDSAKKPAAQGDSQ